MFIDLQLFWNLTLQKENIYRERPAPGNFLPNSIICSSSTIELQNRRWMDSFALRKTGNAVPEKEEQGSGIWMEDGSE